MNLPSSGAVQRTDPTKSEAMVLGNNSWMNWAVCPLPARGISFSSKTWPCCISWHVTFDRVLLQVADCHSRTNSSHLMSSREDRVLDSSTGADPGDSDLGVVEPQGPTDWTVCDNLHRASCQIPPAVGGDREFP